MPSYSWVAEKAQEAMKAKLAKRGVPNYRQLPLSERYGSIFTGGGADGQVDPRMPAGEGMAGTQRFQAHEGEQVLNMPEGAMIANAQNTMATTPGYCAGGFKKGYASGGFQLAGGASGLMGFRPTLPTGTMSRPPTLPTNMMLPKIPSTLPTLPTTGTTSKIKPLYLGGANPNDPARLNEPNTIAQNTIYKPPATPDLGSTVSLAGQQALVMAPVVRKQQPIGEAVTLNVDPQQGRPITPFVPPEKPPEPPPPTVEPTTLVVTPEIGQAIKPLKVPPVGEPVSAVSGTQEDAARQAGLQYLQDQLTNSTSATAIEGRRAADELALRQQQERSALEQQLLQQGTDPGRARVEQQILRNKQESELNDLAAKYGIADLAQKTGIAGTLATQGLAGQQAATQKDQWNKTFDDNKARYQTEQGWKDYESKLAAMDYTGAAAAYKKLTGTDISMEQMTENRNYMRTRQAQDVVSGDIANDAARFNLTSARMRAMVSDINNGVPLATINSTYGTNGTNILDQAAYDGIGEKYRITMDTLRTGAKSQYIDAIQDAVNKGFGLEKINELFPEAKLTLAEYKAIYDTTATGVQSFERDMSFAKTLLEAGGTENIKQASAILGNRFPGTDIDFTNLITKQNAATFDKGMSRLSDYVAANMDWKTVQGNLEESGILKQLGMDERQVEQLYRGMKVNVIDEQWNTIKTSDWYNSDALTDADRKDMQTFFSAVLMGKLDYTIKEEFTYTDKAGKTQTAYFNSLDEANNFATQNGATRMTATGKSVVNPITNVLGPSTIPGSASYTSGKTSPWSDAANTILANGKNDENYMTVVNDRVDSIYDPISGEITDPERLLSLYNDNPDDPVYMAILRKLPTPKSTNEAWGKDGQYMVVTRPKGKPEIVKMIRGVQENNVVTGRYTKTVLFKALDGSEFSLTAQST